MNAPLAHQTAPDVLCIGGINLDRKLKAQQVLCQGSSNPCAVVESPGGVARNVAENLARLGLHVSLTGQLGRDAAAQSVLQPLHALGVDTSACIFAALGATGSYTALLDMDGQLVIGMADMALTEQLTPALLQSAKLQFNAKLWMVDMNLPATSLTWLAQQARVERRSLVMLAVSEPKMDRLPHDLQGIDTLMLNRGELAAWHGWFEDAPARSSEITSAQIGIIFKKLNAAGLQRLAVTFGDEGVVCMEAGQAQPIHIQPEPLTAAAIVDVSGAGDALCAGLCASYLRHDQDTLAQHLQRALRLAALTIQSEFTVSPAIKPDLI